MFVSVSYNCAVKQSGFDENPHSVCIQSIWFTTLSPGWELTQLHQNHHCIRLKWLRVCNFLYQTESLGPILHFHLVITLITLYCMHLYWLQYTLHTDTLLLCSGLKSAQLTEFLVTEDIHRHRLENVTLITPAEALQWFYHQWCLMISVPAPAVYLQSWGVISSACDTHSTEY